MQGSSFSVLIYNNHSLYQLSQELNVEPVVGWLDWSILMTFECCPQNHKDARLLLGWYWSQVFQYYFKDNKCIAKIQVSNKQQQNIWHPMEDIIRIYQT